MQDKPNHAPDHVENSFSQPLFNPEAHQRCDIVVSVFKTRRLFLERGLCIAVQV